MGWKAHQSSYILRMPQNCGTSLMEVPFFGYTFIRWFARKFYTAVYCYVEFLCKLSDKFVNKRYFLKITNLDAIWICMYRRLNFNYLFESFVYSVSEIVEVGYWPQTSDTFSTTTSQFLGIAKAYFFCPKFQISLIYAFNGCP